MRIGSLFSGYGGLDLGAMAVFGGEVVWHCDPDPAASAVLARHWPGVANLGDITGVDFQQVATVRPVDVLTGGFPCQDLSTAGRCAGLAPGTRSGLWTHMAGAIDRLRPSMVVIENVRGILSAAADRDLEPGSDLLGDRPGRPVLRALGAVLGDLADLRYDARWCGLHAADVGAPHSRFRLFLLATTAADAPSDGRHQGRAGAAGQQRGLDASLRSAAVPHADCATGREWRQPASGQAQTGKARADVGRRGRTSPPHPESLRQPTRHLGSGDTPQRSEFDCDLVSPWGDYAPAIKRWEHLLGRGAPEPTEPGRRTGRVLSPQFVEWLMGLPAGWVTDVPGLSRGARLRLLGNGVVPQQATAALTSLTHIGRQPHTRRWAA